jgi:hypothetical protein
VTYALNVVLSADASYPRGLTWRVVLLFSSYSTRLTRFRGLVPATKRCSVRTGRLSASYVVVLGFPAASVTVLRLPLGSKPNVVVWLSGSETLVGRCARSYP